MSTFGFAFHTASPDLGLAISNFADIQRHQAWPLARELSSHLHLYLAEFLQPQTFHDLGFIAVAKGPGGFTGTRIGVVTARTLAQQLNLPLYGISTLAAAAWRVHQNRPAASSPADIAIQMPAQRGELFTAIYGIQAEQAANPSRLHLVSHLPDQVLTPDLWQQQLEQWTRPYDLHQIPAVAGLGEDAIHLLHLAQHQYQQHPTAHWSDVVPFYGQHPVKL